MIKGYQTKLLKLNAPLRGIPAGQTVKVKTKDGVIMDQYWRRRLQDAEIDGCVELVKEKKPKKSAPDKE